MIVRMRARYVIAHSDKPAEEMEIDCILQHASGVESSKMKTSR